MKLSSESVMSYVTQDPHTLDSEVLGTPLANPWKRAVALCIDLIIVAIISKLDSSILFVGLAYIGLRMTSKGEHEIGLFKQQTSNFLLRIFRFLIRLLVIFILACTIIVAIVKIGGGFFGHESMQNIHIPNITTDNMWNSVVADNYSILGALKSLITDLGLSFGWGALYFTLCLSLFNGKTLGKFLLKIKVVSYDNSVISFWQAFSRYSGYAAGLATGLLGFVQLFWDENRQTIQDKIAGTVVIDLVKPRITLE